MSYFSFIFFIKLVSVFDCFIQFRFHFICLFTTKLFLSVYILIFYSEFLHVKHFFFKLFFSFSSEFLISFLFFSCWTFFLPYFQDELNSWTRLPQMSSSVDWRQLRRDRNATLSPYFLRELFRSNKSLTIRWWVTERSVYKTAQTLQGRCSLNDILTQNVLIPFAVGKAKSIVSNH